MVFGFPAASGESLRALFQDTLQHGHAEIQGSLKTMTNSSIKSLRSDLRSDQKHPEEKEPVSVCGACDLKSE